MTAATQELIPATGGNPEAALTGAQVLAPSTLFGSSNPGDVIDRSIAVATALAAVLKKQKLTSNIQGKDYVRVEGWTLLGSMLGVFPVCEWTRKLDNGWEARVEARTLSGAVVGAAEAECLRSERRWGKPDTDDYAIRSMAQTRATAKALRQPLGFIVALAGYEVTPAEEIPDSPEQLLEPSPEPRKDYVWSEARLLLKTIKELGKLDEFFEASGYAGMNPEIWKEMSAEAHVKFVDKIRPFIPSARA